MKQIFSLSKKDLEFSKQEILRLYHKKDYEIIENLLLIESEKDYFSRLAYSNEVYEFLFQSKSENVENDIKNFNWEKVCKNSFSVRVMNNTKNERKIAGLIYESLKNPKVDLKNAETKIVFFFFEKTIICGKLIHAQDKSFNKRKAHMRPELHPTSLSPQLAIACINLTGLTKGKFLDPFCGSGGIIIEAGLIGFDITGYDIDKIMINRAKINLDHYGLKKYDVKLQDATKMTEKFDCIVTDLPYGKSSKLSDEINKLYIDFLKNAYKVTDTAVVLFPDFVDYEKMLGNWKEELSFDYYLHKSLSKKIVLLKK